MARVFVKNKSNGTTYVYESENYWDREKKQSRSRRVCVGKLDDAGNFVPSARFSKPVPDSVAATPKRGPVPAVHTRRLYYGATYLLDQIGLKLGIIADLKECFPNSYRQMLSIVYYLIPEDNASMMRFEKWGETHRHPFGENISSQRMSRDTRTANFVSRLFYCENRVPLSHHSASHLMFFSIASCFSGASLR